MSYILEAPSNSPAHLEIAAAEVDEECTPMTIRRTMIELFMV